MSVTLWLDSAADRAIDLGPTLSCYRAFAEMTRAAGGFTAWQDLYPNLSGVLTQCELQEDAAPGWLADVQKEARQFREQFGKGLSGHALTVLDALVGDPS